MRNVEVYRELRTDQRSRLCETHKERTQIPQRCTELSKSVPAPNGAHNLMNLPICFGVWEETEGPGGNPRKHRV
ncbi:hypothetical protein GDO81_000095 [Engystomops pustulosus]|uniref:Uncharacterized protein n=1 Tax=Engystomops pustulosus TaxID=76066 RepID=A0AAV7D3A5_ENGPU|nr:hypothetical protein GDO81_000095 [Engystomops pustulosus]